MSDSSPLLLNMGAEVATAAGLKPVATQGTAKGANGNEFAGILQSVLPPGAQSSNAQPLIAKQIETNPLLFSQLGGSMEQLLSQEQQQLADVLAGNTLPEEGQALAWQTLLAEYDSSDSQSPRLVIASGDEDTAQMTELSAEELAALVSAQSQSGQADTELPDETPDVTGEDIHPSELSETTDEAQPVVAMTSPLIPGQISDSLQPLNPAVDDDLIQGVGKVRPSGQQPTGHPSLSATDNSPVETSADLARFSSEQHGKFAGQEINGSAEPTHMETEFAAKLEKPAPQSAGTATHNTASLLGSSAYASVAGLSAAGNAGQSTGQVIANLTIPPHNPAWGDMVGDRVQWMAAQNIQEAKIRLNPPELGLLEVRVHVGHDHHTSLSFSSPHSQVRDALETAVPRLREMFGESGLTLGDVNVSHHSMSGHDQSGRENNPSAGGASSLGGNSQSAERLPETVLPVGGSGLLDLYA